MPIQQEINEVKNFLRTKALITFLGYFTLFLGPWLWLYSMLEYTVNTIIITLAVVLIIYIYFKLKYQLKILFDADENILPDFEED